MDNKQIVSILLDIKENIDKNMVTRTEFTNFKDQVLTNFDQQTVILKRLDQERVFTMEIIRRMQKQIDEQQTQIDQLKQTLNI